jgi:hypothetical protein
MNAFYMVILSRASIFKIRPVVTTARQSCARFARHIRGQWSWTPESKKIVIAQERKQRLFRGGSKALSPKLQIGQLLSEVL